MKVEVAYGTEAKQKIIELEVTPGTRLLDAVKASGITDIFPEIDINNNPMGVFGAIDAPDRELREWDRVEIYRPLVLDPREARRRRI